MNTVLIRSLFSVYLDVYIQSFLDIFRWNLASVTGHAAPAAARLHYDWFRVGHGYIMTIHSHWTAQDETESDRW